jgi:DNA gyrase/topoisomerase IV subunit A
VQQVDAVLIERNLLVSPILVSPISGALALVLGTDQSQRLELLEGVLWGIDHLGEVIEVLRGSADRRAAREVLMAPPFELSQHQATGVLDLSVDSVTVERRKQVVEEIDVLRHEISDEGE